MLTQNDPVRGERRENLHRSGRIRLRERVHTFGTITRTATVFDDIHTLTELAASNAVTLPADFEWMIRMLAMAEHRITATGFDTAPCHGDGNVSNVLLGEDSRMLLRHCLMAGSW